MSLEDNVEYAQVTRALSELMAVLAHLDAAIAYSGVVLSDARAAIIKGKRLLEIQKDQIVASHQQSLQK